MTQKVLLVLIFCVYLTLLNTCAGVNLVRNNNLNYVTIKGHRFATLENQNPSSVNPRGPCKDASRFSQLPSGWVVAPDNDYSRLAAKMFPFSAHGVIFSNGIAFATVTSATFNKEPQNSIYMEQALRTADNQFAALEHNSLCLRVLITQPSNNLDTDMVVTAVDIESKSISIGNREYAALDGFALFTPCCSAGNDRQLGAYEIPSGWMLAPADDVIRNSLGGQVGSVCLATADGYSYNSITKLPCYAKNPKPVVLMGHVGKNWSVFWLAPNSGSIRIVIMRDHAADLDLSDAVGRGLKTLILTTYDPVSNPKPADNDVGLTYARNLMKKNGVEAVVVGLLKPNAQFTSEANNITLYKKDDQGKTVPLYHSVILTDSKLAFQKAENIWISALSTAQWTRLHRYCGRNKVRLWSLFTYPDADTGFVSVNGAGPESKRLDGYIYGISIANQSPLLDGPYRLNSSIYQYPVKSTLETSGRISPAIILTPNENILTVRNLRDMAALEDQNNVGGVYITSPNAMRGNELHYFFASSFDVSYGLPMGKHGLKWLLKGIDITPRKSTKWKTGYIVLLVIGIVVLTGVIIIILYAWLQSKLQNKDTKSKTKSGWV